jgi:hypothetical protein
MLGLLERADFTYHSEAANRLGDFPPSPGVGNRISEILHFIVFRNMDDGYCP